MSGTGIDSAKRESKRKFKSNLAADKALRRTSTVLVEQLSLFETTLHLHEIDGLTTLEMEKLRHSHTTELERKQYLVTGVIPGKGYYRGMTLLRRALKKSKQFDLYNCLDKAYEEAVNGVIAEKLKIQQTSENKHETLTGSTCSVDTASDFCTSITSAMFTGSTSLRWDGGGEGKNQNRPTSINSNSSDESNDDIVSLDSPLDSPVEQQQQQQQLSLPSCDVDVMLQIPLSQGSSTTTISLTSSPHRLRSNHISLQSHPYKTKKPSMQAVSLTVNVIPENSSDGNSISDDHEKDTPVIENHGSDTLRSVDRLLCDSPVMKFVFVGDASTGKTSLLERYINNKFSIAFEPTILVDFKCADLICHDVKYKLHLWDTAGQERFKAITNAYYREAIGGFVVYDVTKRITFEHCLQWKEEIDNAVQLENGDPIPIVLIANKVDCSQLDGEQFSKEHGFAGYFETSAKTGTGVKEAIHFMVKKIHQLSSANQEPVVRTLSRRHMSIKLQFNDHLDDNSSGKKCCKHQ